MLEHKKLNQTSSNKTQLTNAILDFSTTLESYRICNLLYYFDNLTLIKWFNTKFAYFFFPNPHWCHTIVWLYKLNPSFVDWKIKWTQSPPWTTQKSSSTHEKGNPWIHLYVNEVEAVQSMMKCQAYSLYFEFKLLVNSSSWKLQSYQLQFIWYLNFILIPKNSQWKMQFVVCHNP